MNHTTGTSDLDLFIENQLRLLDFKGKFNVENFIATLSEKLISDSKAENALFDPKPFIHSFELAIDELVDLRRDLQSEAEQQEKNVKVAEREYSKRMSDLNKGFEAVGHSFASLENRMSDIGHTAVRIGEQLESVHIQRERVQAAYNLIDYYVQFSRGETDRLDFLRKQSGKEGRRQLSIILRRLSTVAKEVDLPTAEETRANIEKYCEKFEKDMLNLFDRCYRKEDPKMMHHCAQILQDFNGGTSCVQIYVNQHDFFINRARQQNQFENSHLWQTIADPNQSLPQDEPGLQELFSEIRATVAEEAQIVQAVFPNPPLVMQVFLQRVFAQSIQQYMEQLLNEASSLSPIAFIRILQIVHIQVSKLVEDLKAFELNVAAPRSPSDNTSFRIALISDPPSLILNHVTSVGLGIMLESAMEELFVPYIEGQRYLEKESKSLGDLYSKHLERFTRYHEKTSRTRITIFDRVVNQLSAAAASTSSSISTTSVPGAQAAAAFIKFSGIGSEKLPEKQGEEVVWEEDGKLSLNVAGRIIRWHAEAIGRCIELSSTGDVPKHVFALLRVLAGAIAEGYIETALDTAQMKLETTDPKSEPNFQPLGIIKYADLICHLWQQYVKTALLPLASSSVTTRREMVNFNNQIVSRIESSVNSLLQRMVDYLIAWLAFQLSKQKKNDFKPRNEDLSFARMNTEPCESCCEMLEKIRDTAGINLTGKNYENFLSEIGVNFYGLLLEHLRRFSVNATGGLMLAKDLKSYQDVIATFSLPVLDERFEFIRQLGNIFLVRPDILKSYIRENYLGKIEPYLLMPYLAQRSDWGQYEKEFEDLTFRELTGPDTKVFKDRLGVNRLSMMMKELESVRLAMQ